jgi:glycerol-3-phosphate dehydrogenase
VRAFCISATMLTTHFRLPPSTSGTLTSASGAANNAATTHDVDVLITGGCINGAGIARDLAGRGLSVLLCERDDLAQHTSSSSTKLIHGGLRYLEHYEFL